MRPPFPVRLLLLAAAALLPAPSAGAAREMRLLMGTTAEVWVEGPADPEALLDAAFAALAAVDRTMSLWKESELAALNRSGGGPVSDGLFEVLEAALEVAAASGGAFDPTVEPLVRARGGLGGPRRPLSRSETARILRRVGYRRVHLARAARSVALEPGTRLDLGGIAKGYAVDCALLALRAKGARRAAVDLGRSSLGVFGDALALDVADPVDSSRPPWARFTVRDAAIGSSGGGERPGHVFDPRTGRPAEGALAATVVASSAAEADALSTAVYVLGAEEGLALLERRGAAGFVLVERDGRPLIRTTPGFSGRCALRVRAGVAVEPDAARVAPP